MTPSAKNSPLSDIIHPILAVPGHGGLCFLSEADTCVWATESVGLVATLIT